MSQSPNHEGQVILVDARRRWNDSGVVVEAGQRYRISVAPTETWKDWFVTSGPDGYTKWILKPFEFMRRASNAPWFALMASVNRSEPTLVGRECEFEADRCGRLELFANDLPFMYWNNSGRITVSVELIG